MKDITHILILTLVLSCAWSYHDISNVEPSILADQVHEWASNLSNKLVILGKNLTAYHFMMNQSHGYSYLKSVVGKDLVNKLAMDIEHLLSNKVNALKDLVQQAGKDYEKYKFDPDLNFDYLNSKMFISHKDTYTMRSDDNVVDMSEKFRSITLTPDAHFNNLPVNFNTSTVHVPTTVFDRSSNIINGAYWTKDLDSKFKDNYKKDKYLTWQYFCSTDGFFRVFPGMKWPRNNQDNNQIDFFDCRVRSWYLQAATCPKNVVILIDSSGSMQGLRMGIARSTVKQILNTLADDDYFNILRFSDVVEYVDPCFNGTMMPATSTNKRRLQELIDEKVHARNKANLENVFEESFNLLKREFKRRNKDRNAKMRIPLCNKAILLITDGVPEHHKLVFETHNWPHKFTRVFTFLIGREVKDDREVKWMACANKGFYSHISTLADVQENVQNYIKVLSRPLVINRYDNRIWTSVYLDHFSSLDFEKGLQFMTSVATPVFDLKNTTTKEGNLLGVMGIDVPVDILKRAVPAHKLGSTGFAFLINHNGYVIFHPDYRPHKINLETGEKVLNPNYKNIDIMDVILPVNKEKFAEMRVNMLSGVEGSRELDILMHYDGMKRMVKRKYSFYYKKVTDTNFTLGIALPDLKEVAIGSIATTCSCLNNSNIEIAPWNYCEDLDPHLTGRARIDRLLEILGNTTLLNRCDTDLVSKLKFDSRLTENLLQHWMQNGNDFLTSDTCPEDVDTKRIEAYMSRNGIELVFVGTAGGITKYIKTRDRMESSFILNNTSTIEADYYRRAVEGVERPGSEAARYTFTYSLYSEDQFNINTTLVTGSAPVFVERKKQIGIEAVVGIQMKYTSFEELFFDVTNPNYTLCAGDNPCIDCSSKKSNCYLIDNHGYIMASKNPENDVGAFFGDIESEVMAELVRKRHVFEEFNFTDYQAVCEIKAYEKKKRSSRGTNLLNPLKAIFNGLLWAITEIGIFLSEFSLSSWWNNWKYVRSEQDVPYDCDDSVPLEDYDTEVMSISESVAYNQLNQWRMNCVMNRNRRNRVIGYRPCHTKFKLYHSNFNVLDKQDGTIYGSIPGCEICEKVCNPIKPSQCDLECRPDKYLCLPKPCLCKAYYIFKCMRYLFLSITNYLFSL